MRREDIEQFLAGFLHQRIGPDLSQGIVRSQFQFTVLVRVDSSQEVTQKASLKFKIFLTCVC